MGSGKWKFSTAFTDRLSCVGSSSHKMWENFGQQQPETAFKLMFLQGWRRRKEAVFLETAFCMTLEIIRSVC